MARASNDLVDAVVARGIGPSEARWLVEEFGHERSADVLDHAIARRLAGEPLQYVLGHWPFRGLDLVVDPRVLIPRPETEQLVDVALHALAGSGDRIAVLDLGCGSGAIGLALATELEDRWVTVELTALDESADALAVARENAERCGVTATFVQSDWYRALDPALHAHFDVIVANPPYVSVFDINEVDPVVAYEPASALLSSDADGAAGFADLAAVITGAPRWLAAGGVLVCEHGARQGAAARGAAQSVGMSATTELDLGGLERFLVARA